MAAGHHHHLQNNHLHLEANHHLEALAELHQSLDQEVRKEMAEAAQAAAQEGLDEKGLEVHVVPMVVHHRGHGLENQLGLVKVLR